MELVTEVKQRKQETQLTIKRAAVGVGNGGSAGCGVGGWEVGGSPGRMSAQNWNLSLERKIKKKF